VWWNQKSIIALHAFVQVTTINNIESNRSRTATTMTLPFYDELMMEKKPRVCGAVVFSRFMKNPVICSATSPKNDRKYQQFDAWEGGGSAASPPTTEHVTGTHRSLPSTNSSTDDSSLLRPGSPKSRVATPPQTSSAAKGETDTGGIHSSNHSKTRSCMPNAALNSQNLTRYQDLAKTDLSMYFEETLAGIKTRPAPADTGIEHQQHTLDASMSSKGSSAVARRSMEMDKYFEQHISSQNILQFDPYMMMMTGDQNIVSGIVSPVAEVSELTCESAEPKGTEDLLAKSQYMRQIEVMEDEDDNDDVMWNILYATGKGTHVEQRQPDETTTKTLNHGEERERPVHNNVISMLKEQRETYKSEADALREEMEMIRRQLAGVRKMLPQQKLQKQDDEWEESVDVWDKMGTMEFLQPFSGKQSGDEVFMQRAENCFKKDWEFSFHGRDMKDLPERDADEQRRSKSNRVGEIQTSIESRLDDYAQHLRGERASRYEQGYASNVSDSSSESAGRHRVSFSDPEVSDECEYDENCVTLSVGPDNNTILPPRLQRWKNVTKAAESMQGSEDEENNDQERPNHYAEANCDHDQYEEFSDVRNDVTAQTDDCDYQQEHDNDSYHGATHNQTDDDDYQFYKQCQELEVIPEVDECELSINNGEYTKDMNTVKTLLKKYGKRVSFSMDEQETFSVEEEMPLVQIENIDAVIEYRGAKDPDAWFGRHANLSQDKEEREVRRSRKISLTVALSPKSGSQASSERRRREFGEAPGREQSKESFTFVKESNVKPSCLTSAPTNGRKVGRISRDTISLWETKKW
jgi:hypothetical protein